MKDQISIEDILDKSNLEQNPLIEWEQEENQFTSPGFSEKTVLMKTLLNVQSTTQPVSKTSKVEEDIKKTDEISSIGSDAIVIRGWKNIYNISARLIDYYDDVIILECLVDKEMKIYEEREFQSSLFIGYELKIGNLFYLRIFERPNEARIEVHDDPRLTFHEDFPKKDFTDLFKKSKLFAK